MMDRINQVDKEKEEVFNGSYGFVIKPDIETQQKAKTLAKEFFPNAEFLTTVPHITLYHGRVKNFPIEKAQDILFQIKDRIGDIVKLKQIEIYGSKFAFWNNEITSRLYSMHKQALRMAEYLDRSLNQRAVEEGLSMTEKELENIEKYGHPLVGDSFKPHITLAYSSKGLTIPNTYMDSWEMKIDNVSFTEMGNYGSVVRVVEI